MPNITSLSITDEDYAFVKANGLQFSQLFKEIVEQRRGRVSGITTENLDVERKRCDALKKQIDKMQTFLENEGIWDKFYEWCYGVKL